MRFSKRFFYILLWLVSSVVCLRPCIAEDQVEFVVLICSYNNAQWCKKNLDSVFCQTYPHWRIHYVDDCSTDGTGSIVDAYIKERGFSDKCTVVHNSTNLKALANYYCSIRDFDPHKVVVNLDGDDWLAHDQVLETLASLYQDPDVWMTYGSFVIEPQGGGGCVAAFPPEVIKAHSFRQYKWVLSHLRTFYAGLFQKIQVKDFLFKGEFFRAATDLSFMYPMVEMAANGHFRFIQEVLYVYNFNNPLSIFRADPKRQLESEAFIRSKPPYKPLENLF